MLQIPSESKRVRRLVVLALDHKLRTTIVKTENLVVQIETRYDRSDPFSKVVTALCVNLKVRVKVVVAVGTLEATRLLVRNRSRRWCGVRGKIVILILEDVRAVVSQTYADREPMPIVGWTNVPSVRCLAKQGR